MSNAEYARIHRAATVIAAAGCTLAFLAALIAALE
jgi:hypothetical protein